MSSEMELYSKCQDPIAGIVKLGEALGKSALLGFTKSEQGVVLAWECFATGKSPLQVVRRIHITERGQILMRSDAMLAEFRSIKGRVKWLEHNESVVRAEVDFEGNKTVVEVTIEWARKAGLIRPKGAWETNPEAMLQAACIRKFVRMLAPEVIVESGDPEGESQSESRKLNLESPAKEKTDVIIEVASEVQPQPVLKVKPAETLDGLISKMETAHAEMGAIVHAEEKKLAEIIPLNKRPGREVCASEASLLKIQEKVGAAIPAALKFLRSNDTPEGFPWIGQDDGIEMLAEQDAKRIIGAVPQFLSRMKQKGYLK